MCAAGCVPDTRRAEPTPAAAQRQAGAERMAPPAAVWSCTAACLRWRPVLDRLDAHRARAYATGRARLLRRVYVPGSRVLARDRQMLRAWTRRAVTVSGARLRVLDVDRLASDGPSVRLRVVDQLGRATARVRDGEERVALPHDLPTDRVIVLRYGVHGWRIAASR